MNVLILGINYTPEPVGIGPYSEGMAAALADKGHHVAMVTAKPYYPTWSVDPAFADGGVRRSVESDVQVSRLPLYVPANPTGLRRILHHLSFGLRALPELVRKGRERRPDVVLGIAPSILSLVAARIVARLFGAKLWIHVQDFEVEAAFATGLLKERGMLARLARAFERWSSAGGQDQHHITANAREAGAARHRSRAHREFRNWARIDEITPLDRPSPLRERWNIEQPFVALYSGNIANKQGIEIIVEAARLLSHRRDLMFVICGNGPNRAALERHAKNLPNIAFHDLQPMELLPELLGLATVHLLPQIAGAADLVLPSKLTNMLASGRAIVATAEPGTGLAREVDGCGIVTPPENAVAFAQGIEILLQDEARRMALGREARMRAEARWSKSAILNRFVDDLETLTGVSAA